MALVDGEPGVVIAPFGRAFALMDISFDRDGQTLGVGPGAVVPVQMDAALLAALNARAEQERLPVRSDPRSSACLDPGRL